ncbi:cytochrome b/b6 domain-containing protein [Flavihumibacter fluvii]|uniref:cytochrome b/b6 domain-containing protein n=1 Tax=Flavihumibacter fluvii TaxID=2838157 RepID=UPI001BDF6AFF|nr:cytochrome b/b6 domain-containing protein [Flavihumibacter fluvii]ULQ50908.1 cytochrome b/b6 domain-containing protein [Flavihumibacter fluvii]
MQASISPNPTTPHKRWVKITHWIITLSFLALTFTGYEMLMVHPRFYWGEVGNDLTPALFELPVSRNYKHGGWDKSTPFYQQAGSPISASRTYDIFNQNGWGRSGHFLAAWFLVLTGLSYLVAGFVTGHFRRNLWPGSSEFTLQHLRQDLANHLKMKVPPATNGPHYGLLQKSTYLIVIFFLLPVIAITGLTMSPAITAAYPFLIKICFGAQSARTIHFFASVALVGFLIIHVVMVILSGFKTQIGAMTWRK